jgi:hypothetical protein
VLIAANYASTVRNSGRRLALGVGGIALRLQALHFNQEQWHVDFDDPPDEGIVSLEIAMHQSISNAMMRRTSLIAPSTVGSTFNV